MLSSPASKRTLFLKLIVIFISSLVVGMMASSNASAETYPFYIQVSQLSSSMMEIKAINGGNEPVIIKINPDPANNDVFKFTTANRPSKNTDVVIPKLSKKTVMSISAVKGFDVTNFKFTYAWTFGNPRKTAYTDYIYPIPYDKTNDAVIQKVFSEDESIEHKRYRNAYKIIGHDGNIITSRPGIVFDLRAYDTEVPNKSDEGIKGFVRVMHADGTWSEYFNIPFDTIQVRINDYLPEGKVIAKADEFSFAVMLPTTEGVPFPIPYTMNLKSGGTIHTPYIRDALNLEKYNTDKYNIAPWYQKIIKNKSRMPLIIAGLVFGAFIAVALGVYFYLRTKKQKILEISSKTESALGQEVEDELPVKAESDQAQQSGPENVLSDDVIVEIHPEDEGLDDYLPISQEMLDAQIIAEQHAIDRLNQHLMQNMQSNQSNLEKTE